MRAIIDSTYITLDGVVHAPHPSPALGHGSDARGDEIRIEQVA